MRVNLAHSNFLRHCLPDCHMDPLFLHLDTSVQVQVILTQVDTGEKNRSYVLSVQRMLALAHTRRGFVSCSDASVACLIFLQFLIGNLLFTYLLTPWSRVLLEKLTSKLCSQSRNSPHLWNPKVPHHTHKCPPPVLILSQLHPIPTTPSNFLKIHINIILPSTSWSPQWPLSLKLPH